MGVLRREGQENPARTIYLGQELKFTKPVRFGDTVTATCTVTELIEEKNIAKLETVCTNQRNEVVIKCNRCCADLWLSWRRRYRLEQ